MSLLNPLGVQNSNIAEERKLKSAFALIELKISTNLDFYMINVLIIKLDVEEHEHLFLEGATHLIKITNHLFVWR